MTQLLRHKYKTLGATIVVFFITMQGFAFIPKAFFPPSDRAYFKVELELPTGTAIEKTQRIVKDVEAELERKYLLNDDREKGVINWISYVGNAGPKFILSHNPKPASSNYALMIVNVNDLSVMDEIFSEIGRYAFNRHPDLEITFRRIDNGPTVENPVEIRLSGRDTERLFDEVNALTTHMSTMPGLRNVSDDWGATIKKLNVLVDQTRALRSGVSSEDVATSLQAGLSGLNLSEYREGEDIIPIILRSTTANQQDIGKVESLSVFSQTNAQSIPLTQVADVQLVWEAAKIFRRNGVRTVTVGAQLFGDLTASEAMAEIQTWLDQRQGDWPASQKYEQGGEVESSGKANTSIAAKLPIAAMIILILLVSQFNSIRKAGIILTTIPLGLIGVVIGLIVGQSFFGFMTLLGIISLAGIVINNAIVLLERIQIELDAGKGEAQAIIESAKQRARPILLTTATTVLGLLPLYFSGGEMWEPMAIAIMAGLLFSTVLTLCVVPVLYAALHRVSVD